MAGGMASSYSRSDFLDEKSAQSASAIGGGSSNGATAGHSGVDSLTGFGYFPPSMPPPATYNNPVALVARTASGSSTSHENMNSLENSGFETSTTHSTVQTPRRAARKPVPAYGDSQGPRNSEERKNRISANSLINPSYASSINEVPLQPTQPGPNALNHKGSFGESKPMNHVLMPDMPLTQN